MTVHIRTRVGKGGGKSYQAQVFKGKNTYVASKTFDRRKELLHGGEKRNPKSNRVSILSRPRLLSGTC